MGGKRHKGIGMNKAKKKKASELLSQLVEFKDTNDAAEPCPAPVAAPEPASSSPPPLVLEELQDHAAELKELAGMELASLDATNNAIAVLRRWNTTMRTYYEEPSHYHYGITKSERDRVEERLKHADLERKKAFTMWPKCGRLQ